jgi:pyruvate/2-oxoglutarate dehydrogenase complex dihydrolipoamide dehydrogenase (E3) component
VLHAWEYQRAPDNPARDARITIVGGGMVGMEAADLLLARGATVTVLEALAMLAQGMARNNRMELIERVQGHGGRLLTGIQIIGASGDHLEVRAGTEAPTQQIPIGDVLLFAIGPRPVRDPVTVLEAAGVPYELAGD